MRQSLLAALAAALLWTALTLLVLPADRPEVLTETVPDTKESDTETPLEPDDSPESVDKSFRLVVKTEEGNREMDLRTYLTGALLAEMPVYFPEEALMAQAVACRTYALRHRESPRHGTAAICTDAGCCQGWQDPAEAEPSHREKAEAAVEATDGLVILYQGKPIDATFFSCSGGRTEDAAAVWGSDLPYLKSVASPEEEAASRFSQETRLPLEEFRETLTGLDERVQLSGNPATWVDSVQYTAGGGIARMQLGGRSFLGTDLRRAFHLRSTAFRLSLTEDAAVFTTQGNGHRVGMSQYGAQAMALAGNDFETILKWYYQGVEVGLPAGASPKR